MENVKMTDTNKYEAIKEILVANDADTTLVDFCDTKIAQIAAKAEKAKERAAEKKAEADVLTDAVKAALTDEFATRDVIALAVAETFGEDATISKVGYRLTQLVKEGVAEKGEVTVPASEGQKARKLAAYKLA